LEPSFSLPSAPFHRPFFFSIPTCGESARPGILRNAFPPLRLKALIGPSLSPRTSLLLSPDARPLSWHNAATAGKTFFFYLIFFLFFLLAPLCIALRDARCRARHILFRRAVMSRLLRGFSPKSSLSGRRPLDAAPRWSSQCTPRQLGSSEAVLISFWWRFVSPFG